MHVAETFAETKGGKSQQPVAEGGRLAVHSLSARSSRDRQAATATAAILRCMEERGEQSRRIPNPTARAVPSLRCAQCSKRSAATRSQQRGECGVIRVETAKRPLGSQTTDND